MVQTQTDIRGQYPNLPGIYRSLNHFRLGTTSYIYPDNRIPNIKRIGPYLDEIELLLFQSISPDALPTESEIDELKILAQENDFSYNIHLPADVSMTDLDTQVAENAVESIFRVIELTAPLSPSTYTLHLPYDIEDRSAQMIGKWRENAFNSVERLLFKGVESQKISVEVMNYPFGWIFPVVRDLDLSICLDLGHIIDCHQSVSEMFEIYGKKTTIMHLHGIKEGRDHRAIDELPAYIEDEIIPILQVFSGVLSLEIFSYEDLYDSLKTLERWGVAAASQPN